MRLVDDLAATRLVYPRQVATMPDMMLIDLPPCYAGRGLLLGRYYPVILETDAEAAEFEHFLGVDRDRIVVPDLLDRRPSLLTSSRIIFGRYDPPAEGWPLLLLCYWPVTFVDRVGDPASMFARGHYTTEAFEEEGAVQDAVDLMIATLGRHSDIIVRQLGGHAAGGSA